MDNFFKNYINTVIILSCILLYNCENADEENNATEITAPGIRSNLISQQIICAGKQCKGNCNEPKNGCPKKNNKIKCIGEKCMGNCINTTTNCGNKDLLCNYCKVKTYKLRNKKQNCEKACNDCESKVKGKCQKCNEESIPLKTKKNGGINAYCNKCKTKLYKCEGGCGKNTISLQNILSEDPKSKKCSECRNALFTESDIDKLNYKQRKQIVDNIIDKKTLGISKTNLTTIYYETRDKTTYANYIKTLIKYNIIKIKKEDCSIELSLKDNVITNSLSNLKATTRAFKYENDQYKKEISNCSIDIENKQYKSSNPLVSKVKGNIYLNSNKTNEKGLEIIPSSFAYKNDKDGKILYFYVYTDDNLRATLDITNLNIS